MRRASIPMLFVISLAACTEPEHERRRDPLVSRRFVGSAPVERRSTTEVSATLESRGIHCGSFEGSIWETDESWQTTCTGTASQWTRAEPDIARLTKEGILRELE